MVHPARDLSGEPPGPLMQSTLTRFAAFTHTSLGLQVCSEQSHGFAVLPRVSHCTGGHLSLAAHLGRLVVLFLSLGRLAWQ